jgi:phage gpG-like protein
MSVEFNMSDLYNEVVIMGEHAAAVDLKFLRDDILESIIIQFETEGHGSWEHLSPHTLRRKKNPAAGILIDTGAMKRSIFGEYSSDELVISVGVPYARYHMTGTKNMPKRNFSDINLEEIIAYATGTIIEDIAG